MKTSVYVIIIFILGSVCFSPSGQSNHINTHNQSVQQTYTVDDEGDGDFTAIQQAIDTAQPGDIIHVYSGTYHEQLLIKQPNLSIQGKPYELGSGNDSDHPIIDGGGIGDVIRIETEHTILSGFIIQHSGSMYPNAGIFIISDNNTIIENGIIANYYGILVNNCSSTIISQNYILSNQIDGIILLATNENIISDNIIKENGFQGIYLLETTQHQIKENTIALNGKDGIQLNNHCRHHLIEDNEIYSNSIDGIKINHENNTDITIRKNTIESNKWNGIHIMNGAGNQIMENDITLNLFNGIHLGDSDQNIISKNTISENLKQGITILFEDSIGNSIYHNNIINDDAIDYGDNQWDNGAGLGGNYWSYYDGSDENNDGIGDTPVLIPGNDNQDNYPIMYPLLHPSIPQKPKGPGLGIVGQSYIYTTQTNAHTRIQYGWDWNGDYQVDEWTDFYDSDQPCTIQHRWEENGTYIVSVKAMNTFGFQSDWSQPLTVTMPKQRNNQGFLHEIFNTIITFLLDRDPICLPFFSSNLP